MSTSVTFNSAYRISLASEFFIARRLILDRNQCPAACELLFCSSDGAPRRDEEAEAVPVIADVAAHGLLRLIGDVPAYLHVDEATLMSDIVALLPPQHVVLEIMPATSATPELQARVATLEHGGFRFAVALGAADDDAAALLPLARIVRIDVAASEERELAALVAILHSQRKRLLADNVDSFESFQRCFDLGFEQFRGYYFTRPRFVAGQKLAPSQLAITELMALVASDADSADIEHKVKCDVALGLNLLRLVNTPALSAHPIDSLRQALMVLGRNQLQRWLQIMLYAAGGTDAARMLPLLLCATTRGRLMELLAQRLRPGNRSVADTAFTVGIMSLMDTLFSMPMEEILQQLAVSDEVAAALLSRGGYFGELLQLAEYTEWREDNGVLLREAIGRQRISYSELYALQLAAFEWSDQVARGMH